MLGIYTFLFAVVFRQRWRDDGTVGDAALQIFAGLIVFQLFRDMVHRAPGLVVGHAHFVKRVVFPLQVLPVCDLLTAVFGFGVNLLVWLVGWALVERSLPSLAILAVPLLIVPVVLAALGISWILASIGVFLRDAANVTELLLTVLFFLTPVFYSIDRIPEPYRAFVAANPIAQTISTARAAMIDGAWPEPVPWLIHTAIGAVVALLGYAFFMKSRRAFADVL
jgi:lipopolysaccharide transport system permease protein